MVAQALDILQAAPIELAERRLRHFVRQAWHVIEPAAVFKPNWHLDAIADHLEAVEDGQIRNLLVTMPPRMGKSLTISVFYPAWRWINKPGARFLYASYAQDLATDHSLATRRVIESDWYQERWADRFQIAGDANLKTRFENDHRGARISTSVGGRGTGMGGNVVVCDDPHNVKEAESDTVRKATLGWWDQVMSTRLNDPKTGARIVVMQRVHHDDLAGHLIQQGGYVHLNLPMEYEPQAVQWTGFGKPDPRRVDGELLAPDRVGEAEVADHKVRLGPRAYAGQFQQRPTVDEGAMFPRAAWRYYRPGSEPTMREIVISVDSAFKEGVGNDYSVFAVWGDDGQGSYYLLDRLRDRMEFPELIQTGHQVYNAWKRRTPCRKVSLLVEDKASGQSAIQVWGRVSYGPSGQMPALPVIAYKPPGGAGQSKESRADGVTHLVLGGRVWLPEGAAWVSEFVQEHVEFPLGAHDDQVDTTSQALGWYLNQPRRGVMTF